MGVRDCIKHIYGWRNLSRRHLFMCVTFYKIFIGGCDCLEDIYWMGVSGCESLKHINRHVCLIKILSWVGVGGCNC